MTIRFHRLLRQQRSSRRQLIESDETEATYETCDEAEDGGLLRFPGQKGAGWGFPKALDTEERDGDGDGYVCEKDIDEIVEGLDETFYGCEAAIIALFEIQENSTEKNESRGLMGRVTESIRSSASSICEDFDPEGSDKAAEYASNTEVCARLMELGHISPTPTPTTEPTTTETATPTPTLPPTIESTATFTVTPTPESD